MEIELPDGTILEAPDGSDASAVAKNYLAKQGRQARIAELKRSNPAEYDADSPEFQAKYGPTAGMSTLDKLRAGAGKAYVDIGHGVRQFFADDDPSLSSLITGETEDARLRRQEDERKRMDAPLMKTGAGFAGNLIGNAAIGSAAMLVPGLQGYGGAALTGGILGGAQPVGTNDSRAANAAFGAAGGLGGKYVANRLQGLANAARPRNVANAGATAEVGPGAAAAENVVTATPEVRVTGGGMGFGHVGEDASAGLNAAQRTAMRGGEALGMRTTPGQATGSRALQQMEAKLESQPMTSGPFNTIKDTNQRVLNRAWARAIGEDADTVDSSVLARADERIGRVFERASDDRVRTIDPDSFLQRLSSIEDDFDGLLVNPSAGINGHPLVQKLLSYGARGRMTGEEAQNLSSKLGKAAHSQFTTPNGDRAMGEALGEVKDIVDDLLQNGMPARQLREFQAARTQYRNLLTLLNRTTNVNPSSGNVSGVNLASTLMKRDKRGFTLGRNTSDAYNATRFAQAFKPIVGDSGTATRSGWSGNPLDLVARVPLNIASRAYLSTPSVRAATAASAAAQGAGGLFGPLARPIAPIAPYVLPSIGGLFGTYAAQ